MFFIVSISYASPSQDDQDKIKRLDTIPDELLLYIARYLDFQSLCQLRLTKKSFAINMIHTQLQMLIKKWQTPTANSNSYNNICHTDSIEIAPPDIDIHALTMHFKKMTIHENFLLNGHDNSYLAENFNKLISTILNKQKTPNQKHNQEKWALLEFLSHKKCFTTHREKFLHEHVNIGKPRFNLGTGPATQLDDGRVITALDNTLNIWDLNNPEDQQLIATLSTNPLSRQPRIKNILKLANDQLALIYSDNTLQIWNTKQLEEKGDYCVTTLKINTQSVIQNVIQLQNGQLAVTYQSIIKIFDLSLPERNRCTASLNLESIIYAVIQLNNGLLVSSSNYGVLKVWDLNLPEDNRCVTELISHTRIVPCLIQLTNNWLVSTSYDSTLKVWNLNKPKGKQCIATLKHDKCVSCVIQLTDGRLLSTSSNRTMKVWDLRLPEADRCVATLEHLRSPPTMVKPLAESGFDPFKEDLFEDSLGNSPKADSDEEWVGNTLQQLADGRVLSYCQKNSLKLWDITKTADSNPVALLDGHRCAISLAIQLKDGRLLSSSDDSVIIWNLYHLEETL